MYGKGVKCSGYVCGLVECAFLCILKRTLKILCEKEKKNIYRKSSLGDIQVEYSRVRVYVCLCAKERERERKGHGKANE